MCKAPGVREHVACQQNCSDSVLSEQRVAGGTCRDESGGVSKGTVFAFPRLSPGPPCAGQRETCGRPRPSSPLPPGSCLSSHSLPVPQTLLPTLGPT